MNKLYYMPEETAERIRNATGNPYDDHVRRSNYFMKQSENTLDIEQLGTACSMDGMFIVDGDKRPFVRIDDIAGPKLKDKTIVDSCRRWEVHGTLFVNCTFPRFFFRKSYNRFKECTFLNCMFYPDGAECEAHTLFDNCTFDSCVFLAEHYAITYPLFRGCRYVGQNNHDAVDGYNLRQYYDENTPPKHAAFQLWKVVQMGTRSAALVKLDISAGVPWVRSMERKAYKIRTAIGFAVEAFYIPDRLWDGRRLIIPESLLESELRPVNEPALRQTLRSFFNTNFIYTIGKNVRPDGFNPNPLADYSNGIYGCMTLEGAMSWGAHFINGLD